MYLTNACRLLHLQTNIRMRKWAGFAENHPRRKERNTIAFKSSVIRQTPLERALRKMEEMTTKTSTKLMGKKKTKKTFPLCSVPNLPALMRGSATLETFRERSVFLLQDGVIAAWTHFPS